MNEILAKLKAIQLKLDCPKSQYNSYGGYSYRNCEDILEAVKPIADEMNCVITLSDEVIQIGERYYVKACARCTDIDTTKAYEAFGWAREADTRKGMDTSQITGATSSYARKYALNALLCIDDSKDADMPQTTIPDTGEFIAECTACGTRYQFANKDQMKACQCQCGNAKFKAV